MAYTLNFVADFGNLTGLTLNARLYDDTSPTPVQIGGTITTGFAELPLLNGAYSYKHTTIPNGHVGSFVMYKASDPTIKVVFSINPQEAEYVGTINSNVAAILDDTGTSGVVISTAVMNAIADALLKRSVSNVETTASTHSLAEIILAMLESAAPATTWTIYRTDGSTVFNTRTLTEDASAKPIVAVA